MQESHWNGSTVCYSVNFFFKSGPLIINFCTYVFRYNAEKKKIGMYYSTPLYQFRFKCHLCDNYIDMKTDPAVSRFYNLYCLIYPIILILYFCRIWIMSLSLVLEDKKEGGTH